MKVSQLKEIIRTKVREATAVKLTGAAALTDPQISQKITQMRTTTGDQTIGTEKNPIKFVKETDDTPKKYTVADIDKMSRAELIDFLGLTREEARKWSDKQLYGAARNLTDEVEKTDSFNANVGSGEYELSVKSHPTRPNFIIMSQNNEQRVVVHKDDIKNLINILKELD